MKPLLLVNHCFNAMHSLLRSITWNKTELHWWCSSRKESQSPKGKDSNNCRSMRDALQWCLARECLKKKKMASHSTGLIGLINIDCRDMHDCKWHNRVNFALLRHVLYVQEEGVVCVCICQYRYSRPFNHNQSNAIHWWAKKPTGHFFDIRALDPICGYVVCATIKLWVHSCGCYPE